MVYPIISQQIIKMRAADLTLRDRLIKEGSLHNGYHSEMQEMHETNAKRLDEIIEEIGYPSIDKVGDEGSAAAWLIIQHAISLPRFMKRCLGLLESAVRDGHAKPMQAAYLSDRIASFQDLPQQYGTQFDWDENGNMSPKPYDDLDKVNERRLAIGLNTLEAQIEIIQQRLIEENESYPVDYIQRKTEYDQWRQDVGWI